MPINRTPIMAAPFVLATTSFVLTVHSTAALPIADIKRDAPVEFAKEIYPVLKRNCLACHNSTRAKASLNLESPELIAKGGDSGPGAIAGRGSDSRILKFAAHMDDEAMPPPDNKVNAANLTADELGLLKLWIDQGMKGSAQASDAAITWRGFPGRVVPVTAAALSPNGEVAAAARGNQVGLFEVPTGAPLGYLDDPELAKLELYREKPAADRDAVMALAFGAGDLLATGGYRTVRLWRRAPLIPQRESAVLAELALCLAAAGNIAAAGDAAGRVWLWDTAAEKPQPAELKDHAAPVKAVAISPDAQFVVSAAEDKSVRVWSAADKSVVFKSESPVPLAALCFLKGGTLLAAAGIDGVLRLYPFSKEAPPEPPKPAGEHRLTDKAPAFLTGIDAAGTRVLWGAGDAVLHEFDAGEGKAVRDVTCENVHAPAVRNAERHVESARRHAEARKARATAADDAANKENDAVKTAHEAMEKARAEWQRKLEAARDAATSLRAAPDDNGRKEAAKKSGGEAEAAERAFVSARTNAELSVRLAGKALQTKVAADAASAAAQVSLTESQVNLENAKKTAAAPLPPVKSGLVLRDNRAVVLVLDGGRLQWHSLESGALCDAAESGSVPLLAATGEHILAARPDKKTVFLPARRPWQFERTIGSPDDPSVFAGRITALSFSLDGRLLATGGGIPSRSGEVKVWNTRDGAPVLTLKDPHSDTVNALAFSPDDSLLATAGSDRWARVFRVSDGQRTAAFEGHGSHVLSIAWRGDGLALATGGADKTLRVWDLPDAKSIRTNNSFGKEVSAVAWLGAGDTIASASGDSSVRLNDDRLPGSKGFTFCLAADLSGRIIAAGGEDGILRVWSAADRKLLREHAAP
jgi:WD40 repeat protein